jgi:hypothetical protein
MSSRTSSSPGRHQNNASELPAGATTIKYAVFANNDGLPADCEVTEGDCTVIRIAVDPTISLRLAGGTLSTTTVSDKRILDVSFTA